MRNYGIMPKNDGDRMCIYDYIVNRDLSLTLNNRVFYEKADKVRRVIDIYNSKINDYEKVKMINEIYPKIEDFNKTVRKFAAKILDHEDYEKIADKLVEISEFCMRQKEIGKFDIVKQDNCNKIYKEVYKQAVQFAEDYLGYEGISVAHFCKEYGYNIKSIPKYEKALRVLNQELYTEYCLKQEANKKDRIMASVTKCLRLKNGISSGEIDGHQFTVIDFFKEIPFCSIDEKREVLNDFNIRNSSANNNGYRALFDLLKIDYSCVESFLRENKFGTDSYNEINEKYILSGSTIRNDVYLGEEEKREIIKYMIDNEIPFVKKAYFVVEEAYTKGMLEIECKKKVLK